MADASFCASGYALMIEEDNDKKLNSKKKTFTPVAFWSKVFSPAYLKMSIYCKEFLAIYHAFVAYSHILWTTTWPTLVRTDNRSATRFFRTKAFPATLWNPTNPTNPKTPNYRTPKSNSRSNGETPRNHKKIQECTSRDYYPELTKSIKQWVLQCEDCIKYKRIKNNLIRPKMINNTEHV